MNLIKNNIGFVIIIVVIMYIVIGNNDYIDQQNSFHEYCTSVNSGIHPDYKNVFKYCISSVKE